MAQQLVPDPSFAPPAGQHFPALALLEFDSVAAGIQAADLMVKRSPIGLLRAGSVHPGRFLVLVAGSVAAVQEAHAGALKAGIPWLLDEVLLPDAHPQLVSLLHRQGAATLQGDTLGIVETTTSACLLRAADSLVKSTAVSLAVLRLADDLGGRALLLLDGEQADVESAVDRAREAIEPERLHAVMLIPRLDGTLRDLLARTTLFGRTPGLLPAGAELVGRQAG
jgi:microcompartment protein CcmL/EutN